MLLSWPYSFAMLSHIEYSLAPSCAAVTPVLASTWRVPACYLRTTECHFAEFVAIIGLCNAAERKRCIGPINIGDEYRSDTWRLLIIGSLAGRKFGSEQMR